MTASPAAAVAVAAVLAASAATGGRAEALRIGANPGYPPYLMRGADGQRTGLDAALLAEICRRGGFECRWVDLDVPALIPALFRGDIDVVTGGIGYSVARDRVVDFTCAYHVTDDAHGTLWSMDPSMSLDAGPVVAVTRDTLHHVAMARAGASLLLTEDNPAAVAAALTGAADIYFGSAAVVGAHPRGSELFELGSHPIPTTGAALAVAEGRPDLLGRLDDLLAAISADGTLGRLQADWLQIDQGDVVADCVKPLPLS